ncbi:DUF429 domain-containing protein [Kitasatospora albolonga]|uniref:DUF429 domain-containing protein n=1 Tax=Kitasatospora albolonga TaxID=68173 RepID=UPI0035EE81BC
MTEHTATPDRTVGVDLATAAARTATAVVRWEEDRAVAEVPRVGCEDEELLALLSGLGPHDRAGIDVPFGWPVAFVEAVGAHARGERWPGRGGRDEHYRAMRARACDRHAAEALKAHHGRGPLCVSFDRLGAVAARWAFLSDQLASRGQAVARDGSGAVVEVYPAGARAVWKIGGERSVRGLTGAAAPWLVFAPGAEERYAASEHAFDALIAALVARSAALGRTLPPRTEEQLRLAPVEGWLHLPGPLDDLAPPARPGLSGSLA